MSRQPTAVPRSRGASRRWSARRLSTQGPALLAIGALAVAGVLGGALAPLAPAAAAAPATAVQAAVASPGLGAAAPTVPGRGNTAVNMFQWTWNAIASECTTTLGPAGYAYVQTSPPQEHIRGTAWWTSYQPVSYKLESKLGTRAEFKAMVDTCNAAGVKIIADTVINHMTGADGGSGTGFAGTPYGIESFPGPDGGFGPNDFNDCKTNIASYSDRYQVQNCRLVSLQDLKTGSDYVRTEIAAYLNDMISLGVVGFRIDAAKHIPAADLAAIKGKLTNPNAFWVHEVIGAAGEPVQPSEYLGSGDSHEFDYARTLKSRFDGRIADLKTVSNGLLASDRAGVFVDNHDTERNGETMNYTWGAKYKLANVFMLAYPYGWPTVYTGYTFTDKDAGAPQQGDGQVVDASCTNSATWTCAHRWPEIKNMVGFRTAVGTEAVTSWWDNGNNQIAFGRGAKGYVAINNEGSAVTRTFQSSLPAGTYCDVVAGDGCAKTVMVNGSGQLTATVPAYGALALHVGARSGGPVVTDPDPATNQTVYYSTNKGWSAYNVHYKVGASAWTTAPGKAMTAACTGWVSTTIPTSGATVTAAFTNGSGTWDNNGSANYTLTGSTAVVKDGTVTTANPCTPATNLTVYYSTSKGWSAYNVHHKVGSGAWTTVPGKAMTAACTGWVSTTIATSGATVTAAFTNGSGAWDNNGSANYTLTGATARVKDGTVTTTSPCT